LTDVLKKAVRVFTTSALEAESKELQSEMAVTAELIQKYIEENAHVVLNQKEYQERYEGLVGQFDKAKAQFE
jgi:soluble cytochrome b562